jgi:hypothetical protein
MVVEIHTWSLDWKRVNVKVIVIIIFMFITVTVVHVTGRACQLEASRALSLLLERSF